MDWQPIKTAPKDGTPLLVYERNGEFSVAHWNRSSWVSRGGAWIIYEARSDTIELDATHWRPLPKPPIQ